MPPVTLPPADRRATASSCRRDAFPLLVLALCAVLLGALYARSPAAADERGTLTIPLNDGYGFEDCLKAGSECGLVVADAWCKAHGFAGSEGFGPPDNAKAAAKAAPGSVSVICGGHIN